MATIDQATQTIVDTLHRLDSVAHRLHVANDNNRGRGFIPTPDEIRAERLALAKLERYEDAHPAIARQWHAGTLRSTWELTH